MTPDATRPPVVVLVRDLLLGSRVTGAAERLGVPVRTVRDPARLQPNAADDGTTLIVDLNLPGALEAAAAWRAAAPGRAAIGFVAHTDADTIARARRAGIDRVMARSRFVEVLPQLLAGDRLASDDGPPTTA